MSNWTTITERAVKSAKNAALLAEVRQQAVDAGCDDPLPEIIADTVSTLRALCSVGNQLDADTTKIPNSLKGLALRMINRALKDYIQMPLTDSEKESHTSDESYRKRIVDQKIRFETPDNASGSNEMQSAGSIDIANVETPFASRLTMDGLL